MHAQAAFDLALKKHQNGDLDGAATLYRKLLRTHPEAPDPLHLLGCIELVRKRPQKAIRLMKKAVALAPKVPLYHLNLAEAYHRSGEPVRAEEECRLALRFDPRSVAAFNRLGVLALERDDLDEARRQLQQSLEIQPLYAEGLVNLAAVLNRQGEFAVAENSCRLALELEPKNALAWNHLGLALKGQGQTGEATQAFQHATAFPPARYNLGYMKILAGDPAEGFALCETRPRADKKTLRLCGPRWDGRSVPTRKLLVVHEQGLGDTILMSRYLPELARRFASVCLLAQPALTRLLAGAFPEVQVVSRPGVAVHDCWVESMSLPHLLQAYAGEPEPWIPGYRPSPSGESLRVGINWAGNPKFKFDRTRSAPLSEFAGLLAVPGVEWVSLHRGHREDEAAAYGLPCPLQTAADFQDTAEVVAGLDLVVSTETAVPNLSGAMGVPTLILAAPDHDWRWYGWFPKVQVCAGKRPGEWADVVEQAAHEVARRVRTRRLGTAA